MPVKKPAARKVAAKKSPAKRRPDSKAQAAVEKIAEVVVEDDQLRQRIDRVGMLVLEHIERVFAQGSEGQRDSVAEKLFRQMLAQSARVGDGDLDAKRQEIRDEFAGYGKALTSG